MTSYPQHMVFYYLTPARFGRYSNSNLCPAPSSLGRLSSERTAGGTWLVNLSDEGCRPTGRVISHRNAGNHSSQLKNVRFQNAAFRSPLSLRYQRHEGV